MALSKTSELSTEDDGRVRAVYCLRRGYVAASANKPQVKGGDSQGVAMVEVRFRGSEGDEGRKRVAGEYEDW